MKNRIDKTKTILIVFIIFTTLSSITTQYLAYIFMYQPSLTGEIYHHIYQPFAWIEWHIKYYQDFVDIYLDIYTQVIFGFSILVIIYFAIKFFWERKKKHLNIYRMDSAHI